MIVPSMTRKEIADHLLSECYRNQERIEVKAHIVANKMQKAARHFFPINKRLAQIQYLPFTVTEKQRMASILLKDVGSIRQRDCAGLVSVKKL